jgi:hypothetical protein
MSFWKSNDKIPIQQTKISVPSTNGLEYSSGGRILIEIPAGESGLEFFQPRETYLKFDVKLSNISSTVTRAQCPKVQLDEVIGAQVLIKNIRISSGGARNLLLEEIQDYNVLTRLKYDYESNENLRNKRALTEGASGYTIRSRGDYGTTKASCNDSNKNAYFNPVTDAPTADFGDDNMKTCKVLLPLNTGIFNNDKIFPIGLTEGLRIEIDLEDKSKVFRGLDNMNCRRSVRNNPVFHSKNGRESPHLNDWDDTGAGATIAQADGFYITRGNGCTSIEDLPFSKGQRIGFIKGDLTAGPVALADFTGVPTIDTISASATADGGSGLIHIKFENDVTNLGSGGGAAVTVAAAAPSVTPEDRFYLFDLDAELDTTPVDPAYTISNVEMIVQQVGMPAGYTANMRSMMKEGGVMNYDFLSFTNYKYSQQVTDRVMNMRLPLGNSRAKAILSVPTDSTVRNVSQRISCRAAGPENADPYEISYAKSTDHQLVSNSPGLTGVWDYLTNYQWFYDGKLNPSRPVDCAKISVKKSVEQQPLIELEKALAISGIQPLSFRAFQSNCVIGRALSTGDGVYDCRGKDFNLQANYQEGAVGWRPSHLSKSGTFVAETEVLETPQLAHLWNNFVSHIRRLSFKGDAITLEV